MPLETRRVPLTIIGGFLGAGKTTLIRRLLTRAEYRIAVLVNDFGTLNIDAALIASSGATTVELTNGCICCSIGDDLNAALIRLEPQLADFNHVVIEASGVSDPWKIAQIGLINAGYRLDAVIVVVDAAQAPALLANPRLEDTVYRQCRRADLLLLNKIDLIAGRDLNPLRTQLTRENKRAKVIECAQAEVPFNIVLSGQPFARQHPALGAQQWAVEVSANSHATFHSRGFRSTRTWTRETFQELIQGIAPQLLRGKAVLKCQTEQVENVRWLEWHRVCGRDSWLAHTTSPPTLHSQLLLIDMDPIDSRALEAHGWLNDEGPT